ncbi:hypothetical protein J2Q11_12540 [Tenacibaculum finnmarkense genomovar finnmarkense]|uniref:hypothetical protein n=1 Tax=Tenacibaculum finnmarkense TaxID=2781243 RepID=UPI000C5C9223|nr:hypothetical protein [Tenacibaculum finnmarkense]MBE7661259.1 hypothetical protein [Tenacibaculum finnmarkense genomovar finnmarkense]MCD8418474.1 hypothetical protein [Tenacibaculum finnmarkense genomovar finnmarkense]MCD8440421.1 hypothetical protein [Tenacibaculum finnmarkense genomovar ulcerans]MCG8186835.1 hypothetical protein [Tenacibaculum finnmarkense genomovar finnmarkense]MCG8203349.1 hypothetical protein [Tenacibaculum finnmarkense genomovar finnmarkense]
MTNEKQHLGGTRQSSPLDDEMTYPLTKDEYLTIKDNLSIDKISTLESILISTFIAAFISGIIIFFTGDFIKVEDLKEETKDYINIPYIITLIIYGAVSFGSLIGFFVSKLNNKKAASTIERLDIKIKKHLDVT